MAAGTREGVVARHHLAIQDLTELQRLVALCKTHDELLLRLDYNMLDISMLPTNDLFFFYVAGQLVGCLLLDRYHSDIKEVNGLVHPAFRRRGIFRQLFLAAHKECLSRGIHRMLLTCETTSLAGQAFIHSIGGGREFAEYRMLLQNFQPPVWSDSRLLFRQAVVSDLDNLAFILADDFAQSKESAYQHVLRAWERPNQRFYIAFYEETPVGTLRIEETPEEAGIYGFFVRPEYRGRGYGRQILSTAIATVRKSSQRPLMLEVDTNNFTALQLYRSLGFVIERTYEYYSLTLT